LLQRLSLFLLECQIAAVPPVATVSLVENRVAVQDIAALQGIMPSV